MTGSRPDRSRGLSSLVWPLAVLAVGALTGWAAETAVGRFQAYGVYGLARPVADLTLVIGGVWLVVALIRLAIGQANRPG